MIGREWSMNCFFIECLVDFVDDLKVFVVLDVFFFIVWEGKFLFSDVGELLSGYSFVG